ncbi:hypothetical protein MOMA_04605 [Moraxella macacae 0408225]|uniref:Haem-binding uptake Tiki superfamily ChaN domain-containing protein n=1 Tax=Moraxella macacae 0408225 TaxID=1230338 RepID=L2F9F1_9GAMM|nr:ChaN family lipoprotein [Moraxella macacae]ELA09657.1 hypothetical protein MOMA_04605 [Moraxella macacae 0408225]
MSLFRPKALIVALLLSLTPAFAADLASIAPINQTASQINSQNQIINLNTKQPLSFSEFAKQLSKFDAVILGEYHDKPNQHSLAAGLLDALQQQRPQGSLLLEMLTVEQQDLVDKARQKPNLNDLQAALNWQKSWDWQLYGEIVKRPFVYNYSLIATNLTKPEVNILLQGAEELKGYQSTTTAIKQDILQTIIKNHDLNPDELHADDKRFLHNMVAVQQFRDRRMAEKLLSAPKPALLLAGNYHAQKDIGVPIHLQDLKQDLIARKQLNKTQFSTAVVMMVSNVDELSEIDNTKADFIWLINENF